MSFDLENKAYENIKKLGLGLEEMFKKPNIITSLEDIEDENDKKDDKRKNSFKNIVNKTILAAKNSMVKLSTITKNIALFKSKMKMRSIYKKYLGRIDGLFERYANESQIKENELLGDPVEILENKAFDYIHNMVKGFEDLYNEIQNYMNKMSKETSYEKCLMILQPLLKYSPKNNKYGEDSEDMNIKKKIKYAVRKKIADILLQNGNHKIYGYTEDTMVLKNMPPPNHLIVHLFVKNPEEKPTEQSVSDIFNGPESFEIMADVNKSKMYEITEISKAILGKGITGEVFEKIQSTRNRQKNKFSSGLTSDKSMNNDKKQLDNLWKAMDYAANELLNKKVYAVECINVYFDMMRRIDNLCYKAIESLLVTESNYRDKNYNSGINSVKRNKTKEQKREDNLETRNEINNLGKQLNKK